MSHCIGGYNITVCNCLYQGISKEVDNMDDYMLWLESQSGPKLSDQIRANQILNKKGIQYPAATLKYSLECVITGDGNMQDIFDLLERVNPGI